MRKRPWFIVILAALHVLTPISNIITQCLALGITPLDLFLGIKGAGFLTIYRYYLLMPIAGYAIWAMKRWSYPVFFGSWLWCISSNYLDLKAAMASRGEGEFLPAGREAFSIALNLAMISYFVLPRMRDAYYRPNIRWWEHQPRYVLSGVTAIACVDENTCSGVLENLSLTGIKMRPDPARLGLLSLGECVQLTFEALSGKYKINGQIVRVDDSGAVGIRLLHSAKSRSEIKALTKKLKSANGVGM